METDINTGSVRWLAVGRFGISRHHHFSDKGETSTFSIKVIVLIFVLSPACRSTATTSGPISAGTLLSEYEQSTAATRRRYDGKEISVRGFALSDARLPANADQGSVWLQEANRATAGKVGCWFSRQQSTEFSQIRSGQYLTIKGIFNGEAGVELKFCRLVKVE